MHKTPSPIPKTPPTSSVTRYHIVGNVPLSKDRRKTTFNLSFSDNESDASDDLCIMEAPVQTTPTNKVTIDDHDKGPGLENVTPPTNRLHPQSSDEDEQLEQCRSISYNEL